MMGWHNFGMGPWGWALMLAAMTLFWGLVIFAVVMIFRRSGASRTEAGSWPPKPTALEILDQRFARGEVDREEYESRKAVLNGGMTR